MSINIISSPHASFCITWSLWFMFSTITIIGGSGAMGVWFAHYFKEKSARVILNARNHEKLSTAAETLGVEAQPDFDLAVRDADLVLISVPIRAIQEIIRKTAPKMKKDAILMEIASVKGEIPLVLREMQQNYPITCACVHPMFGGGAKSMEDHRIVFIPVEGNVLSPTETQLADLFQTDGATLLVTNASTHDELVAITLATSHFINIAFGAILTSTDKDPEEIASLSGTTFQLQKTLFQAVMHESPEVYAQIELENPNFLQYLEKFQDWLGKFVTLVKNRDYKRFQEIFSTIQSISQGDPTFEDAYSRFYKMVDALK